MYHIAGEKGYMWWLLLAPMGALTMLRPNPGNLLWWQAERVVDAHAHPFSARQEASATQSLPLFFGQGLRYTAFDHPFIVLTDRFSQMVFPRRHTPLSDLPVPGAPRARPWDCTRVGVWATMALATDANKKTNAGAARARAHLPIVGGGNNYAEIRRRDHPAPPER